MLGPSSLDALQHAVTWSVDGPVALAILTSVEGGGPRRLGAVAAFAADGRVAGTLSAGCIDGAIAEAAPSLAREGGARTMEFDADPDGLSTGLTCGARLRVHLIALDATRLAELRAFLADVAAFRSAQWTFSTDAAVPALAYAQQIRLRICGATSFASALVRVASACGIACTVIDPRAQLLDAMPHAARRALAWPHDHHLEHPPDERDAIVVLAHDAKFELPLLAHALRSRAFFIGALGSRQTAAARRVELLARGISEDELARLRSPLGLDLGGSEPEETAIAILAEILAVRNARTGRPLVELGGPIHASSSASSC